MPDLAHRILIIRYNAIGDALLVTPIIRALATATPLATIDILTKQPALFTLNRYLSQIYTDPQGLPQYDRYIDLEYEFFRRQSILSSYAQLAGVKLESRQLELPLSEAERAAAELFIKARNWQDQRLVGIQPCCQEPLKRWPLRHFHTLAHKIASQGDIPIIMNDTPLHWDLPGDISGLGLSIRAIAALIERCAYFIGIDSALLHVAQAYQRPALGIFGPTDPQKVLSRPEKAFCVQADNMYCINCYHNSPIEPIYRLTPCPYLGSCLQQLPFEQVWDTWCKLRSGTQPQPLAAAPTQPYTRVENTQKLQAITNNRRLYYQRRAPNSPQKLLNTAHWAIHRLQKPYPLVADYLRSLLANPAYLRGQPLANTLQIDRVLALARATPGPFWDCSDPSHSLGRYLQSQGHQVDLLPASATGSGQKPPRPGYQLIFMLRTQDSRTTALVELRKFLAPGGVLLINYDIHLDQSTLPPQSTCCCMALPLSRLYNSQAQLANWIALPRIQDYQVDASQQLCQNVNMDFVEARIPYQS